MRKFVLIIVIISLMIIGLVLLVNVLKEKDETIENEIYTPEEEINLISNVEHFLFTRQDVELIYDGGPSHWGSKTVTFKDRYETDKSKVVILDITDQSDMSGELPKKQWTEKWEVNKEGSLYINDIQMLKSPIDIGNSWVINEYTTTLVPNVKYPATVTITKIEKSINESNEEIERVHTTVTIYDIKLPNGNVYTENRIFETGIGLKEFKATDPTVEDSTFGFWIYMIKDIEEIM